MAQDLRLSKYDLQLIEQAPFNFTRQDTLRALGHMSKPNLLRLRQEWSAMPDLYSDPGTMELPPANAKKEWFIKQILEIDWPNGLCVFQLVQMYISYYIFPRVQSFFGITLTEYDASLLSMSKNEVVNGVQRYFEDVQKGVSIYVQDTDTENVFLCVVAYLADTNVHCCLFLFSPTVPFFIVKADRRGEGLFVLIKEAITSLYRVKSLKVVAHGASTIPTAASGLLNESSGLFATLKDIDIDSDPLDIVSKLSKTKKTKYVSGKEVSRRITALDEEEIKKRLELKDDNFGADSTLRKHSQLKLKVIKTPGGDYDDDDDDDDDGEIEMDIVFKGKNVGLGLKQLVEMGAITTPCEWLETYASEPTDEITITADGVESKKHDA